jgi:hypothetical protein
LPIFAGGRLVSNGWLAIFSGCLKYGAALQTLWFMRLEQVAKHVANQIANQETTQLLSKRCRSAIRDSLSYMLPNLQMANPTGSGGMVQSWPICGTVVGPENSGEDRQPRQLRQLAK